MKTQTPKEISKVIIFLILFSYSHSLLSCVYFYFTVVFFLVSPIFLIFEILLNPSISTLLFSFSLNLLGDLLILCLQIKLSIVLYVTQCHIKSFYAYHFAFHNLLVFIWYLESIVYDICWLGKILRFYVRYPYRTHIHERLKRF